MKTLKMLVGIVMLFSMATAAVRANTPSPNAAGAPQPQTVVHPLKALPVIPHHATAIPLPNPHAAEQAQAMTRIKAIIATRYAIKAPSAALPAPSPSPNMSKYAHLSQIRAFNPFAPSITQVYINGTPANSSSYIYSGDALFVTGSQLFKNAGPFNPTKAWLYFTNTCAPLYLQVVDAAADGSYLLLKVPGGYNVIHGYIKPWLVVSTSQGEGGAGPYNYGATSVQAYLYAAGWSGQKDGIPEQLLGFAHHDPQYDFFYDDPLNDGDFWALDKDAKYSQYDRSCGYFCTKDGQDYVGWHHNFSTPSPPILTLYSNGNAYFDPGYSKFSRVVRWHVTDNDALLYVVEWSITVPAAIYNNWGNTNECPPGSSQPPPPS